VLFSHGPIKSFSGTCSCKTNENNINVDVIEDIIEND
jgi:hypothetical protein